MNDRAAAFTGLGASLATLGLSHWNAILAFLTGICGLVIAFPAAVRTVRETDWKKLFALRRPPPPSP